MESIKVKSGAQLLSLSLVCRKADRDIASASGLTVDQVHCIQVLYFEKPQCVGDLCEALGVSPSRTSKILRSLEEHGYITRSLQDADRRKERVSLTEAGMKIAETAVNWAGELSGRIFPLKSMDSASRS